MSEMQTVSGMGAMAGRADGQCSGAGRNARAADRLGIEAIEIVYVSNLLKSAIRVVYAYVLQILDNI